MKKMLFVMNPYAGTRKANRYLADMIAIFNRADYTVITHMTAGPGDATEIVRRMAAQVDVVVCCGGDGTFNETINGVLSSGVDVPIGYIPAGSTNDFAASLHLPTSPLKAAQQILEGHAVSYDVGLFNQRYFSYVASFGVFTKSSYATPQNVKNALGHTAYLLNGIQELSQMRNTHVRLELDDGEVIEDDFLFGAVSNSTSVGGILTLDARQVDLQDGKFELLLVRVPKNLAALTECIQALQTQKYNCDVITFRTTSHLRVTGMGDINWTLDGERMEMHETADIRNVHRAIRLLQKG